MVVDLAADDEGDDESESKSNNGKETAKGKQQAPPAKKAKGALVATADTNGAPAEKGEKKRFVLSLFVFLVFPFFSVVSLCFLFPPLPCVLILLLNNSTTAAPSTPGRVTRAATTAAATTADTAPTSATATPTKKEKVSTNTKFPFFLCRLFAHTNICTHCLPLNIMLLVLFYVTSVY